MTARFPDVGRSVGVGDRRGDRMSSVAADLRDRLRAAFRWTDPGAGADYLVSDRSGWWRDPAIIWPVSARRSRELFARRPPDRRGLPGGHRLPARPAGGPRARRRLRRGLPGRRPPAHRRADDLDRGRSITAATCSIWAYVTELLDPGDRVLVVDDWAATGAQARALRRLLGATATSAPP